MSKGYESRLFGNFSLKEVKLAAFGGKRGKFAAFNSGRKNIHFCFSIIGQHHVKGILQGKKGNSPHSLIYIRENMLSEITKIKMRDSIQFNFHDAPPR